LLGDGAHLAGVDTLMQEAIPQAGTGALVLDFYRRLPFNVTADPDAIAAEIRSFDSVSEYPPLRQILNPKARTLDVGCGGGWLSNSIAYHYRAPVTGVDFNPVAVEFAKRVSASLGVAASFEQVDLFAFEPDRPYDVVVSLGVLHHTADCMGALRRLCRHTVRRGGFLFVGLYHLHGRRPFLQHFGEMKRRGANDDAMLAEFARLIGNQPIDHTHLVSWFRDQVLHPHETQHTLSECANVLLTEKMELLSTSLNDYARVTSMSAVFEQEEALEDVGRKRLLEGRYYPGFFCFLARRLG
jgi:2-polyprenyl-3-methyl-5-hydroxy-6-metoxy-1,4-benzoquinol methylase